MKEHQPVTPDTKSSRSQKDASRALEALGYSMMNSKKPVSKGDVDTVTTLITKHFLREWSSGYPTFTIQLGTASGFNGIEFKVPQMTQDFIERFVEGRETMTGFLHRDPSIKMKVSPKIFASMKSQKDILRFFKAAIQYYDHRVDQYCVGIMTELRKQTPEVRRLAATKLNGLVTLPLSMLFVFEDVSISDPGIFKIPKADLQTINYFMKSLTVKYPDLEKDQKRVLKDLKNTIAALKQNTSLNENAATWNEFAKEWERYQEGAFKEECNRYQQMFEKANTDSDWPKDAPINVQFLSEKFGVKKLKKIPRDLVAYITIEAENIRDANDKMMIASYCVGKIEIVEWYIELIDTQNKKYIVPHDRPYLVSVRTQLLACYKKIMDTPIPKPGSRPLIDIQYPPGYEG